MKIKTQDKLWAVLTEEERDVFKRHYKVQIRDERDRGFNDSVRFIFGEHNLNPKPNLATSESRNLSQNTANCDKPKGNEVAVKEIDWEQRKYEVAKNMLAAFLSNSCSNVYAGTIEDQAKSAVEYADALIYELKSKTE